MHFALVGRAVPQCGAGSSTDATLQSSPIRSATSQSRACTRGLRTPVVFGIQSVLARPPPQGRVEECPQGATGVRVQHGQPDVAPNIAVRAVIILEACVAAPSERWCRRNAERNELQALPDLASCTRLLYVCVRCPLLSVTCRYRAEALLWFAAGSSATIASKLCPKDFRTRCSGCAPPPSLILATPLCECRAHGG